MRFLLTPLIFACVVLSACSKPMDREWLEQQYTNEASNFIPVDGNRVHYRDEGEGDVVLLLHGTASSLHTWDSWVEDLKKTHRVIRLDLPGFGLTGPDHQSRYEVNDDVLFLEKFLKQINVSKVHMAGSSLGGRIAWQYAVKHPSQVKSLTLINALGYPQASWPPPIQMAQWPVFDIVMENFSPRFMYEIGLKDVYFDHSQIDETLVNRYFELSRYPGNLSAFPRRVKARLDQDSQLISSIRVPTLIMWGEADRYFPVENASRFGADIADSKVIVFDDVGHLPMEEVPGESLLAFMEFVDEQTFDNKDLFSANSVGR